MHTCHSDSGDRYHSAYLPYLHVGTTERSGLACRKSLTYHSYRGQNEG